MTSKAREREAAKVSTAYQIALAQIGVGTVADAITLWEHMPPALKQKAAQSWLDEAVELVMTRRGLSVALARAYYRLVRALLTGSTVADPYHPEPTYITLGTLRAEFAQLTGPQKPAKQSSSNGPARTPASPSQGEDDDAGQHENEGETDDDDRILVEEIAHLKELEEAAEKAAEEEARLDLDALGPANQDKLVDQIDHDQPATEVDKLRQDAHDKAGARQAAAAERVAMNGGRSTVWTHQQADKRALGWARVSLTGTPCGWCAMLISRGAVYRSERSATRDYDDGDKYHDNCHCIAIPVFTRDQFGDDPIFKLNREYQDLWPQVTRGLSGKSALSAWRRFIRTEQAAAKRSQAA